MTALKIEYRNPKKLIASEFNARTHSETQISQIAKSIQDFGFNAPVIIDQENGIIAGHGRVMAALSIKLKEIPVIVCGHLSDREKRAYIIADNKLALNSNWDFEKLSAEVSALTEMDFDISTLGFNEHELDAILKNDLGILPGANETTAVKGHLRKKHQEDEPDEKNKNQYSVIVMCETEEAQKKIHDMLSASGHKCKIVKP